MPRDDNFYASPKQPPSTRKTPRTVNYPPAQHTHDPYEISCTALFGDTITIVGAAALTASATGAQGPHSVGVVLPKSIVRPDIRGRACGAARSQQCPLLCRSRTALRRGGHLGAPPAVGSRTNATSGAHLDRAGGRQATGAVWRGRGGWRASSRCSGRGGMSLRQLYCGR